MIVVSGVLVLVALVFLIIGLFGTGLGFIWASIVTSVIAGVFLLLGALQRRGAPAAAADGMMTGPEMLERVTAVSVRPREEGTEAAGAGAGATGAAADAGSAATSAGEVSVVPGRPRYHVESCRFLTGRPDVQSLAVEEARAEGYTACGVCKPDAALAAATPAGDTGDATGTSDMSDAMAGTSVDLLADGAGGDATAGTGTDTGADMTEEPAAMPARKPAKRAAASKPAAGRTSATASAATDEAAPAKPAKPAKKAAAAKPAKTASAASGGTAGGSVVVIPDRGKFHTDTCRFVKDVPGTVTLTKANAKRQGYTPCGVCKP